MTDLTKDSRSIPVTVVIPVKNEELNLPGCLARLDRFSEVVVIDSGSTDRTIDIAAASGARVIDFKWDGHYPKKRNWFLLNHTVATEWVLFLDADEYVTDEFCDHVVRAMARDNHNGYWINYTNYFLGRRLKFGVPQRKLAMFKFGAGLYERIEEMAWSSLDMEIHEHPLVSGSIGEIAAPIDHRDFRGLAKFLDRHREYAMWEASRKLLLNVQTEPWTHLTSRQKFKYRHIESWWYSCFYFVYTYFVKLGLLDGAAGFHYAFYKAWYFLSIRLLVGELKQLVEPPATVVGERLDQTSKAN